MAERPSNADLRAAVAAWDERCDLDYRCPQAGRWPRSWDEYAAWAWDHAPTVVAFLRWYLDGNGRGDDAPDNREPTEEPER